MQCQTPTLGGRDKFKPDLILYKGNLYISTVTRMGKLDIIKCSPVFNTNTPFHFVLIHFEQNNYEYTANAAV